VDKVVHLKPPIIVRELSDRQIALKPFQVFSDPDGVNLVAAINHR